MPLLGNLLNKAQTLIPPEPISFYKFSGRAPNSVGQYVSVFEDPIQILANVQAVPRNLYDRLGLEYTRRYIMLWASTDLADLYRDNSSDQIAWNGRRYDLMNESDWFPIDGWNSVLAIEVADA